MFPEFKAKYTNICIVLLGYFCHKARACLSFLAAVTRTDLHTVLQVTYKALEQLTETGFDLGKVEAAVRKSRHSQNLETLLAAPRPHSRPPSTCQIETLARDLAGKGMGGSSFY